MIQAKEFYTTEYTSTLDEQKKLKKQALLLSMLRLSVFVLMVLGVVFFWGDTKFIVGSILIGIVLFLVLVRRSADTRIKLNYVIKKKELIEKEFEALKGNYSVFHDGEKYKIAQHDFSNDLDMFGKRSIFQYLNRTSTPEGEAYLASLINSNDIKDIPLKQAALAELENDVHERVHFHTQAKVINPELPANQLIQFLKSYEPFIPKIWKYLAPLFVIGSLVVLTLYFFDVLTGTQLLAWYILGSGLSSIYVKKVNKVQNKLDKSKDILQNYSQLILHLEEQKFQSELLQQHQQPIKNKDYKFSEVFQELNKYLGALDQRNNAVFITVAFGLLLWDIQQMLKIERWISKYQHKVEGVFDEIAFFDAYYALAHSNFINASFTTPEINTNNEIVAEEIAHPLMPSKQAIRNNFKIRKGDFQIITGANMAGKSTFLRTIGTSIVLANLGLKVNAKKYSYWPLKLVSSMRTEDSLQDNESYFFAELQRLQYVNTRLAKEDCFVILDEILKGTNSKDKAEGSRKYVQQLLKLKATGLIATHDLSLCSLEDEKEAIVNYCFEANIENDELSFDYKLKSGVCKNMNASFLLRKMGLVED